MADRASALGSYVESLKADLGRSDESFRQALDVCGAYTRAFVKQLEGDWREHDSPDKRRTELESLITSYLEREAWIDKRFTRGSQSDVPRALRTVARRQFRLHGLDRQEPVLTVGPPDGFETHQSSLGEFLFGDFWVPMESRDQELRLSGAELSIFSVPYIEGTRVLWYPIVLGHEIAHTRLDRGYGSTRLKNLVDSWTDKRDVAFGSVIEETIHESRHPSEARLDLKGQTTSWATELVCDLNAVRLFGPAGLSAIAEFLSIVGFQHRERLTTETHPPLAVRLHVLFEMLERMGWTHEEMPPYASVWREQSDQPLDAPMDERAKYVASLVTDDAKMGQLIEVVEDWGDHYSAEGAASIRYVKSELLDGVPGATHSPRSSRAWRHIAIGDVVNASWEARRLLEESGEGGQSSGGALLRAEDLDQREKRVRLEHLASKAIDTLELSRLWGSKKGFIAANEVDRRESSAVGSSAESGIAPGGVLSRRGIADLLVAGDAEDPNGRMVVTPLHHDSVQDAAIDLRLGPDFIVFRHSATTAFDPLAEGEPDPRTMQERVHKSWGERFILHPQELVLASTLEYIVLPEHVAAQVLTRSSYGRLGLLTATAVQVQPGSRGCITLELVNQGETPIALSPAARVAQLMLWSVVDPCSVESGKYWFPVGPEFSKVSKDKDHGALQKLVAAAREPAAAAHRDLLVHLKGSDAERLLEVSLAAGARDESAKATRRDESRRLGPEVAESLFLISASIAIVANTIIRWKQAKTRGTVITLQDGELVIYTDEDLPANVVVVRTEDEVTVRELKLPPDTTAEVAESIRRILRG